MGGNRSSPPARPSLRGERYRRWCCLIGTATRRFRTVDVINGLFFRGLLIRYPALQERRNVELPHVILVQARRFDLKSRKIEAEPIAQQAMRFFQQWSNSFVIVGQNVRRKDGLARCESSRRVSGECRAAFSSSRRRWPLPSIFSSLLLLGRKISAP